jgi:hypothetical protein
VKRDGTVLTAFGRWLWKKRISDAQFAEMLAKHLRLETFSKRTVEKWRYGKRIPGGVNMRAVKELTGVSADSFFDKPVQPSRDGADARLFSEAIAALKDLVARASELGAAIGRAEAVIAKSEAPLTAAAAKRTNKTHGAMKGHDEDPD